MVNQHLVEGKQHVCREMNDNQRLVFIDTVNGAIGLIKLQIPTLIQY